jgi:hypothetical protein
MAIAVRLLSHKSPGLGYLVGLEPRRVGGAEASARMMKKRECSISFMPLQLNGLAAQSRGFKVFPYPHSSNIIAIRTGYCDSRRFDAGRFMGGVSILDRWIGYRKEADRVSRTVPKTAEVQFQNPLSPNPAMEWGRSCTGGHPQHFTSASVASWVAGACLRGHWLSRSAGCSSGRGRFATGQGVAGAISAAVKVVGLPYRRGT